MMTGLSRETTYRERTAIVFDTRKVLPQGLAGQIVLPGDGKGSPAGPKAFLSDQFFRPPFFAGFRCLGSSFTLVNQHIVFGDRAERVEEIEALGRWLAEVRVRRVLGAQPDRRRPAPADARRVDGPPGVHRRRAAAAARPRGRADVRQLGGRARVDGELDRVGGRTTRASPS